MTEAEFLKAYNPKDFDAPLCTVDMAIFAVEGGALKILLVKREEHPHKGRWALPGGFADLKNDKAIEGTAYRKLAEKTGIKTPYLEQVEGIGNASRDPRGWSVTLLYFALVDYEALKEAGDLDTGAETSEWVALEEALQRDLAFDHALLLRKAVNRLRAKTRYTALPISLMPETFTFTELQTMYELILGRSLQKKSFRRRLEASGILVETGEMRATARRPAAVYRRAEGVKADYVFPGVLDVQLEPL